ncbi:MAG TPA: tRNA adenosine(34) deaminase TadA [SAR86 cluster bacterium]|jgi:tRNA(adenine34) deaminase|nr:tRNA adenosine(34) deaminase TadA [SAR86 cluster bacterium]|tara:strand:+ start:13766 stop:14218 length:453 start_codon:yes stop_codon:yes gene_type:complete
MNTDLRFMEMAITQAKIGYDKGEVPVGAVVVIDNEVIAQAYNNSVTDNDPTSHAEIKAIRETAVLIENYRLTGAQMFVTLEPCMMCCGALIHARFEKVIFAAEDIKSGAVVSNDKLLKSTYINHLVKFEKGPLAKESSELLSKFFKARRL